jgi:hypothetical protein
MRKQNEKTQSDESGEERQKTRRQSKNTKQRKKSSKTWPVKQVDIDPVAFAKQIELINASINKRKSEKPLHPKDVQNHLNAISATVSKRELSSIGLRTNLPKVASSKGQRVPENMGPEVQAPGGTANNRTGRNLITRNK